MSLFPPTHEALALVPDPQTLEADKLMEWLEHHIDQAQAVTPQTLAFDDFKSYTLKDIPQHDFGPEACSDWRRFFLAVLLADWASYERPVDRIDFARLKYILTTAYPWFRLWLARTDNGFIPVGYSAWYPLSQFVFNGAACGTTEIDDRGAFLPLRTAREGDTFQHIYVLNISVVKSLRNTPFSVRMLRALHREGKNKTNAGLMAVTVDDAGNRFSQYVGMNYTGKIKVQGELENLYVRQPQDL